MQEASVELTGGMDVTSVDDGRIDLLSRLDHIIMDSIPHVGRSSSKIARGTRSRSPSLEGHFNTVLAGIFTVSIVLVPHTVRVLPLRMLSSTDVLRVFVGTSTRSTSVELK